MTVIAFDTLKYTKILMDAGVPQRQAEGQAKALAQVIDDQLATKQDILDLKRDLILLEHRLENKLLLKLGTLIVACAGISTTILGVLISVHA